MEASGLKTGSTYQKSHGGAGNQRSRRPSKSRPTKGQVSRFKANAAKFSYRRVPKQTTSKRTLSLLQAVNEAVKNAKVRFHQKVRFPSEGQVRSYLVAHLNLTIPLSQ